MAITKGFPSSSLISPSIRITEKDVSFVDSLQSTHRAGLVGFASKGPINEPTLITSTRMLNTIFGYPHPDVGDPYLIYAAQLYLLVASEVYIVRVAEEDAVSDEQATVASVDIPAAGGIIEIISDTAGPYTFDTDGVGSFFRWKLNGNLSNQTLTVIDGTYDVDELATELNDQLPVDSTIEFFVSDSDTIGVRTTWAYGPDSELELVSVQNSIYGGAVVDGNVTGLGTGMTQASVTGILSMYPDAGYQTPGVYDFTGLSGLNLQIVVDGTDNVLIDNITQVIDLADLEGTSWTLSQVVSHINDQRASPLGNGTLPGGWVAEASGNNLMFKTLHYGRDARLRIKSTSTAEALFGLSTETQVGDSGDIYVSGDAGIEAAARVIGSENTGSDVSFTITADSAGIEGNQTQVKITNNERDGTFNVEVYNNGVQVESWGPIDKNESSTYYVGTYLALVSDYILVEDNTDIGAPPLNGTYTLAGGSDGIPADPDDQDSLLIGSEIGATGIYSLSESEQIEIDLIAVPGHSSTSIVTALLDMCQNVRLDCLAIIDPPFGLTVSEIVDWQNGTHPLNDTRFDSDFGAMFWPWVRIRDNFNRVDVWVPPSGAVMATIARSDFLAAPWFAPAGESRGQVFGIDDVYNRPSREERDLMYGSRNCINPIIFKNNLQGFYLWGQKTLQRKPSKLDRINVRRLMFYIEKRIARDSEKLLFDPNDEVFVSKFEALATAVLREVQIGRGIYDFKIDARSDNTADVIDRNEFRAKIGVQPIPAVEFMFLEFSIHRTGSFDNDNQL
jgi:hypothetical protein